MFIDLKVEEFQISFGSGLSKIKPGRSPLLNNLNSNLAGDIGEDLEIPDEN